MEDSWLATNLAWTGGIFGLGLKFAWAFFCLLILFLPRYRSSCEVANPFHRQSISSPIHPLVCVQGHPSISRLSSIHVALCRSRSFLRFTMILCFAPVSLQALPFPRQTSLFHSSFILSPSFPPILVSLIPYPFHSCFYPFLATGPSFHRIASSTPIVSFSSLPFLCFHRSRLFASIAPVSLLRFDSHSIG